MSVRQISVFAKNEKGSLLKVIRALSDAAVDLRSICVADTADFGILRIVVAEPEKAEKVLTAAGFTARVREVVAAAIPDEAGSLTRILSLFDAHDINLEYMYSVVHGEADKAYMVFRVSDNEATEKLLSAHGYQVLTEADI